MTTSGFKLPVNALATLIIVVVVLLTPNQGRVS
jgi:hypothetical protein